MDQVRQGKKTSRHDGIKKEKKLSSNQRSSAPIPDAATSATKPQRTRKKPAATAIFIHAGAGFHSHENEKIHLQACQTYVFDICFRFEDPSLILPLAPLCWE